MTALGLFSVRRIKLALFLFGLLALGPLAHTQSEELVENGGFEAGAGMPDGWTVPTGYGAWDTDEKVAGARSLRLTNGDASVYRLVTQEIVCSPGARSGFIAPTGKNAWWERNSRTITAHTRL